MTSPKKNNKGHTSRRQKTNEETKKYQQHGMKMHFGLHATK